MACVGLFVLFAPGLRAVTVTGLALFFGGASSNLLDRVVFGGVVDFLNLGWGGYRTSIFNLADVEIVAGLALVLLGAARRLWRGKWTLLRE